MSMTTIISNHSKVALICLRLWLFQALKMLRTPELKPFIVYVKAPPFDRLKETRHSAFARSTFDETSSRSFTVSSADYQVTHLSKGTS